MRSRSRTFIIALVLAPIFASAFAQQGPNASRSIPAFNRPAGFQDRTLLLLSVSLIVAGLRVAEKRPPPQGPGLLRGWMIDSIPGEAR